MTNKRQFLAVARAEALFTSELSAGGQHTPEQIAAAIKQAVRHHGGIRGCLAEVAAAYGERPETAAPRMRWARSIVEQGLAQPPGGRHGVRDRPKPAPD